MTEPVVTKQIIPPNDQLASIVASKLKEQSSIPISKHDEVLTKLKSGTATSQDWRLWIELGIPSEKTGEANV